MLVVNILNESSNPRSFPLFLWYLFLQQKSNFNQLILDFEGEGRRDIPTLLLAALASGNLHGQGCMAGDPLERVLQSACSHKPASHKIKS
jgi:hypothetical protein